MASFSTLPPELLEEILLRTPAESLVRSMTTCKQWYDIIKEESFIYKHLDRSPLKFLRTDETLHIMDPVTRTCSESPMPDEFQPPYNIRATFLCDGLMLCKCNDLTSKTANLALWNPLTRRYSWIDEPSQRFFTFDYYGIGYVVVNEPQRDYKILKFSVSRNGGEVEIQIYECMSKSWRTLDRAKVDWKIYPPGLNGVPVKGYMYWLAKKKTRNYVIGFDFSGETFKEICFCLLPYDNNYLGCFDGDKLSLLEQNVQVPSPIEVWVSSKLGDGNVSFHRYFKVTVPDLPALRFFTYGTRPVYCIAEDKRIITWCQGVVLDGDNVSTSITLYEIDGGGVISNELVTVRSFLDDYAGTYLCGYVYVPSLVPLPV